MSKIWHCTCSEMELSAVPGLSSGMGKVDSSRRGWQFPDRFPVGFLRAKWDIGWNHFHSWDLGAIRTMLQQHTSFTPVTLQFCLAPPGSDHNLAELGGRTH